MSLDSRIEALANIRGASDEQCSEHGRLLLMRGQRDAGRLIECLDDGFVRLVDHMGDDAAIVRAARVSYGKGTKTVSDDRNLIRYLMRHRHTTPFEMVETVWHVRVPMHVWRQWIRHRTASVNEYSTRYSVAIDSMQATDQWRLQSKSNRQGSETGEVTWPDGQPLDNRTPSEYLLAREREVQALCREVYEERLRFGVAREQARKDLPLSTYTEAYWKIDGHNLLGFLELRMDRHAQVDIQIYAIAIAKIVKSLLPITWEAFEDYRLNALTLSFQEQQAIRKLLHPEWSFCLKPLAGREREEFSEKLESLGFSPIEGQVCGKLGDVTPALS
jgi:thymidylate synthase (FAD)